MYGGCYRVYYRTNDGQEGFFAVEAMDWFDARDYGKRLLQKRYDWATLGKIVFMREAVLGA